jgi:hypothetical protein
MPPFPRGMGRRGRSTDMLPRRRSQAQRREVDAGPRTAWEGYHQGLLARSVPCIRSTPAWDASPEVRLLRTRVAVTTPHGGQVSGAQGPSVASVPDAGCGGPRKTHRMPHRFRSQDALASIGRCEGDGCLRGPTIREGVCYIADVLRVPSLSHEFQHTQRYRLAGRKGGRG